ncbi:MAG: bacteriochlorophyll 4-vinyl reductase [Rubrimonas sp.]|uniref:bacteriochlorophyll 4-vinyl reductase n=1 Tax=Rubrimonas sp. TaxID=2036015 RepID=UPI002FDEA8A5
MTDDAALSGRIGPNAVTRLAEALTAAAGRDATAALFAQAGLSHHLAAPPERMVEEADVVALHRALAETRPDAEAVAAEAGARTARYLLAHRIPKPVQALLRVTPPGLAARILLAAIRKNAWTFAGTGAFAAQAGRDARVEVIGGPFAAPGAAAAPLAQFYASVFESLFRRLVSARTQVRAEARDGACALALTWRAETRPSPLPRPAQAR